MVGTNAAAINRRGASGWLRAFASGVLGNHGYAVLQRKQLQFSAGSSAAAMSGLSVFVPAFVWRVYGRKSIKKQSCMSLSGGVLVVADKPGLLVALHAVNPSWRETECCYRRWVGWLNQQYLGLVQPR